MTSKDKLEVGEFVRVPAWDVSGQIIAVEPAWYGSDDCQRVQIQEHPRHDGRWYHLEPADFVVE